MYRRWNISMKFYVLMIGLLVALLSSQIVLANEPQVRIKDITRLQGVRDNQLVGIGLVVGLAGTGDSASSQANIQMLANMLERFQISIDPNDMRSRNIAAVTVTAELPAFARPGDRIDVTVSSIGDARSLQGGLLLMTPLQAGNGDVYAVAQGAISIGGFNVGSGGSGVQRNHTAVGRIPEGAIVERDGPGVIIQNGTITFVLREPDFGTAQRVAKAINDYFTPDTAIALDHSAIRVTIPSLLLNDPVLFVSLIEELKVTPDTSARVIINERTGTVVIGHNVRIGTVAVAHGGLNVRVTTHREIEVPALDRDAVAPDGTEGTNTDDATPPEPIQIRTETRIEVTEEDAEFMVIKSGATVEELVAALNAIGAGPRDVISVLQAIKAAGALYAELEVL